MPLRLALILVFAVEYLAAQADFRSTTRLVQVNVVAREKGKPAEGLTQDDFRVTEGGRLQRIAYFFADLGSRTAEAPEPLPRNVFSNRQGDRIAVPTAVTVLLIDSLNTPAQYRPFARDQVLRFLRTAGPGDRIAVYALGTGLRIIHDFTSDPAELAALVAQDAGDNTSVTAANRVQPLNVSGAYDLLHLQGADAAMNAFTSTARVDTTLKSLEWISNRLAAVPGRKNLLWVSTFFSRSVNMDARSNALTKAGGLMPKVDLADEVERALKTLNSANIAVYPLDPRGLTTWTPAHQETMRVIAERTGGRPYYNRNDLDGAMREVLADTERSYTVGYYSDRPEPDGRFREISVRVSRPGVEVRHRKGYYALPDRQGGTEADLRNALLSPLEATAIPLNVSVERLGEGWQVVVQVDPSSCTLDRRDERFEGRIEFALALRNATGGALWLRREAADLRFDQAGLQRILSGGILFRQTVPREPGATVLRIVVRDVPTGLTGSVTVPLTSVQ